jgi:fructan beta-fructosidase
MKRELQILISVTIAFIITSCEVEKTTSNLSNFNEEFRPQVHFSPDSMWMNDPNGMVFYEGEYHLFYQYFPDSIVWGPMHWGHAISTDLIHWEHMPIAIKPDYNGWIYSGSAVVDWNNTTKFAENGTKPLIAIFTQHLQEDTGFVEQQSIAYSIDKGRSWKMFIDNPVLKDTSVVDFRDPKVFWHNETGKWIMTLACRNHVRFYSSPNMKTWVLESEFGKEYGSHGGVWECPELIQLPVNNTDTKKWTLLVSLNPGGLHGGSGTQYFVGDFNGNEFVPETPKDTIQWLEYGADNYAGVTWSNHLDENNKPAFMGWMSNWQYATLTPTKRWRSAMTLPRYLSLIQNGSSYSIQLEPLNINKLKSTPILQTKELTVEKTYDLVINELGGVYNIDFTLQDLSKTVTLTFSNSTGDSTILIIDKPDNRIIFDRTKSGITAFKNEFGAVHVSPFYLNNQSYKFQIIVDKSSIEIFINDGAWVATEQIFPSGGIADVSIAGNSIKISDIAIHNLKSIW